MVTSIWRTRSGSAAVSPFGTDQGNGDPRVIDAHRTQLTGDPDQAAVAVERQHRHPDPLVALGNGLEAVDRCERGAHDDRQPPRARGDRDARRLGPSRPERFERRDRAGARLVVTKAHDPGDRGAIDREQRPVAQRRAEIDGRAHHRRRGGDAGEPAEDATKPPGLDLAPGTRGHPYVRTGRVRRLVGLAPGPGRRVRRRERPERRREDQQQRGTRVPERPPGELACAERRHQAAVPHEDPLGELREARDDPDREHRPADQADRRRRDEQRVHAERTPGVAGDRRPVQAQLDERERGERDEHEVEAQPLGQRPPDLAADARPDAGDVDRRGDRRDREREERDEPAQRRDGKRRRARQGRHEADGRKRRVERHGPDEEPSPATARPARRAPSRAGPRRWSWRGGDRTRRRAPAAARSRSGGARAAAPRRGSRRTRRARRTGRAGGGSLPA